MPLGNSSTYRVVILGAPTAVGGKISFLYQMRAFDVQVSPGIYASLLIPGYGFTAHSRGPLASPATRKQISSSTDCKHLYDDSAQMVLHLFGSQ